MTDKPTPKDEPGIEERFERGIAKALKTSPKPHKPKAAPTRRKLGCFAGVPTIDGWINHLEQHP